MRNGSAARNTFSSFAAPAAAWLLAWQTAGAQVSVTTYHNDNSRTGQNTLETVLNPANVNSGQFGKLFTVVVDGYVFAQPLYLAGISIGGGTHNVLYVATEHDSVYGIDADSGTVYWQTSLIPAGGRTVEPNTDIAAGCDDIVPEIGITGTPVIDPSTETIYVVSKAIVGGQAVQYLHALDAIAGGEKFGGPVLIEASVPGTAVDAKKSVVAFNPLLENQRPGLLLENGHVIIAWGSHCDVPPWHGWLMSYGASSLAQEAVFNSTPNGYNGGIWMSGGGVAADANGNLFLSTGNGDWNGTSDFGDTILKLGPPSGGAFPVLDYFTPFDQAQFNSGDLDVASSSPILLPSLPSGEQLLALMAKIGTMYVINRNDMGKYCVNEVPACAGSDPQIAQEIPDATYGVWGVPAYWNGHLYWGSENDQLSAFSFNTGTGAISTAAVSKSRSYFAFPAPVPSVSANGTADGILWGVDSSAYSSECSGGLNCQVLYAFDATNLNRLLYSSSQAANYRDVPGSAVKFATPIIANGKVYFGGQYAVSAYGELAGTVTQTTASPSLSPPPGSYSSTQTVTITDATPGAVIYYTTNGLPPSAGSAIYAGPITISATTPILALGIASGDLPSAPTGGTYIVNSAQGTAPLSVDLSSTFNTSGIYAVQVAGTAVPNGGLDGKGDALAENLIGTTVSWSGGTYVIGLAGQFSGASSTTISLPAGNFSSVNFLAVGVDGNQTNQVFTLNYADGTSTNFTQSISDWHTPQAYPGESVALSMAYEVSAGGAIQNVTTDVYGYSLPVPSGETVQSITLPANRDVVILAMDATPTGTVVEQAAANPTFSPGQGTYVGPQTVTLSDATPNAVIYYTLDGSTPTTSSTQYNPATPLQVAASTQINAFAAAAGYSNSVLSTANYTIESPQGGASVAVSLASAANVYAIGASGTAGIDGGLDYSGNTYSAALLGSSVTWGGATFQLGTPGTPSGVRRQTISLPAGNFAGLALLATAVNGSQPGKTFVVKYTDGTATTVAQSISDWLQPQNYAGESSALTMPYYIKGSGAQRNAVARLYGYTLALDGTKTVASLTLPNDPNVVVLAVDLLAGTVANPTFSPAPGTYSAAQSVSLATTTAGAAIYYTTNGSTPTVDSAPYTQPITVGMNTTIAAIAIGAGGIQSGVVSGNYVIESQQTPVAVNLSAEANVYAIGSSGDATPDGGIDFSGRAYDSALLGTSITWSTANFVLGAPGAASGVRMKTIVLPPEKFAGLDMLAAAVNGAQPNQLFTVNYTDGTSTVFTQSLSDWLVPRNYPGESVALQMPGHLGSSGTMQKGATYVYGYSFAIDSTKTVASLTLPVKWNMALMALDLIPAAPP